MKNHMLKTKPGSVKLSINESDVIGKANLQRRNFLKKSGMVAVTAGFISVGGVLVSPEAWATNEVGEHASKTLLKMGRDTYPHDFVEDKYYAQVLIPMAEEAKNNSELRSLLVDGVSTLDEISEKRFGGNYLQIESSSDRETVLKEIAETPFFGKIKGGLMMGIYNNKELWPKFDYGGSSWEKGGYLNDGYDADLDWLT